MADAITGGSDISL